MQVQSPVSDLSDAQLESLVLAWMTQELAIAPEGAHLILRMLHGHVDPQAPLSRARTLALTRAPEALRDVHEQFDMAVADWLDAHLIDIINAPTYSIPVGTLSVTLATGLEEPDHTYFRAYLQANKILLGRTHHYWPGYDMWHLEPTFVDQYRRDLQTSSPLASSHGGTVGERYQERVSRLTRLARSVNQYMIGTRIPADPFEALDTLSFALQAEPEEILAAERALLTLRDADLPPRVRSRWA